MQETLQQENGFLAPPASARRPGWQQESLLFASEHRHIPEVFRKI
jgi:hypothetical protein